MTRILTAKADDFFYFSNSHYISQISYIIVDGADGDIEMVSDLFLEVGIDMPKELQYRGPQIKRRGSC